MKRSLVTLGTLISVVALFGLLSGYFTPFASDSTALFESTESQLARPQSTGSAPATSGLISYWKFDEGVGTTAANTVSGAAPSLLLGANWTTGISGNALAFPGTGTNLVNADISGVNTSTRKNQYNTVNFWMKWDGASNGEVFGWGAPDYTLSFVNGNCFGFSTGNGEVIGIPASELSGNWVNVSAIFYNGVPSTSRVKIYINGQKRTLTTCQGSSARSAVASNSIHMGSHNGSNPFGGLIDEMRIYNRALSSTETTNIYLAYGPITPSTYSLSISTSGGTGSGTVSASNTAYTCSSASCTWNIPANTPLTLNATPATGSTFRQWGSGACTGTSPTCQVTMDSNKNVQVVFDMIPVVDTPPTVPTNLLVTNVSSAEIGLSWSASTDDKGVSGYKLYRNGSLYTNVTGTTFQNTGVSPDTLYTYQVSAYDTANNESAKSNAISTSTLPLDTSNPQKQIILIGVDGMQYNHMVTMMNAGRLPNYQRLVSNGGISTSAQITGHTNTATAPGNAELHTGLPSSITTISDNTCSKAIPPGLTIFERLNSQNSSIKLGLIYGKLTCYIPNAVLANARNLVPWWITLSNYPMTQYISSAYANSLDVSTKALEFLNLNKDNPFYLVVYYGVPDGAGHKYGENSPEYDDALINTDQALGIVLDWMQENNVKIPIIISADHGWNEGTTNHSETNSGTLTLPLLSNDTTIVTPSSTKKQCSIAPTIYKYFNIPSSVYSDVTNAGCYAMY